MKKTPRVRYVSYSVCYGQRVYRVLAPEGSTVVDLVPLAQSVMRTDDAFIVMSSGRVLQSTEVVPHRELLVFITQESE